MAGYFVNSSNLHWVDYDSWSATLIIEFRNESVYEYYSVPAGVCRSLLAAESKGRFHHQYIKNNYRYRRIQ
jgi:hypothetical protein